ncbi:uncharacterized protein NFIA_106820 [Aspergillus fischeri NRRL 181]|uniref:Phosphatidylinositol-specific phospholipase C X domain-containing protein n=1 Tax=Neosartorya fischeri (strain ATCC 1020 / DSM 3700 / CBS 544.65 / FGSC A1164 / JCM 1740 / NRRL 181 / WB 181) TaxID=331117 RepID=A1CX41_NEOFI|nr:uncharacterized protein NFIA_106820 [Aspergillus fischeri NRRL 181]EAW25193.1 hypothetical protein NFIA_106820 [Aspergillus fischeri NRRL 181]
MTAIDLANWMNHDASAYKYDGGDNGMHEFVGSICQIADYRGQLLAGSRWFDMRVTREGNTLVMKHGIITFQPFETVLYQIKSFADSHKSEFLFLDLDLTHGGGLAGDVLAMLIKVLGDGKEDAFATAHVGPDGKMYNTDLTWAKLRQDGKQYIIIWGEDEKWQTLGSASVNIRDNWADDYENKSPKEIVNWLDEALGLWKKERLWITQLIDTPKQSYMPGHHPSDCDSRAAPVFNEWLTKFKPGDKLGIVKRDFVNEGWNEPGISHVIRLNKFAQSPELPLGQTINYLSTIRLRTLDGRYVAVDTNPPGNTNLSLLTLVNAPADNTRFLIRHYHKDSSWEWAFSGNLDADSCGANGNVRLVHVDSRIGDDTVVSCAKNSGGFMYWGVGWGPADDWETFLPYDPANPRSSSRIRDGSIIVLRTLWHMYWKAGEDENLHTRLYASTEAIEDATRFVVEKA